jgi:predicted histone-like DNA-binding protein
MIIFYKMIKSKLIGRKNPLLREEPPKFYATAQHEVTMDLNSLALDIAGRCTVRRSDVHGVLMALMDSIPAQLAEGKIVSFGELGTFCVNLKSDGADTIDDFLPSMITGKKIVFRPTKELRDKVQLFKVSLAN